jgi:hypothetical protein
MLSRYLKLIGLIVFISFYSGCAGNPPPREETMLDKNWGRSYESAKYNQILNPEAGKNLEPVVGLDGEAADGVAEKYRKGFKGKPSKKVYNLNLGPISGIGAK